MFDSLKSLATLSFAASVALALALALALA